MTVLALLSGCVIVTIASGPSTVSTGEVVIYQLDLSATGGSGETFYVTADVPAGWVLLSNQYQGTVGGEPVSGVAEEPAGIAACDFEQQQAGFQRIRLSAGPFPKDGLATDTGEIDLEFQVVDQPQGEYKIVFRFGAFGFGSYECSKPAILTINRDNVFLESLETFFDGVEGVDGLAGANAVALSPQGDLVVAAGTEDDSLAVFQRDETSGLLTFLETEGSGSPLASTEGIPTGYMAEFAPDGGHLYAARPMGDEVSAYSPVPGGLDLVASYDSVSFPDLVGLVDLGVLDENIYVLTESLVVIFDREPLTGELSFVGSVAITDGVDPEFGYRIAVSPDGSRAYVAGFGNGYLAHFERDSESGLLTLVDSLSAVGALLWFSPDSRHLYVGLPDIAATIMTHEVDPATGMLSLVNELEVGTTGLGAQVVHGLDFSADGTLAFIRTDGGIFQARRHPPSGMLRIESSELASELPGLGLLGGSDVVVSPDGRHVYTSASEDDAVTSFANQIEVFADGFESGDSTSWPVTVD